MRRRTRNTRLLAALLAAGALAGCGAGTRQEAAAPACHPASPGEVALPGGVFLMGAAPERPEEGPPQRVTVGPFAIDTTEVTNAQFADFVQATGYVTEAEKQPDPALYPGVDPALLKPGAMVFVGASSLADGNPANWWRVVDGANWKHPEGPGSDLKGRERHPVVELSYQDALAYARWRGRDLPTEAEWEFAARGGLDGKRYEHGDERPSPGQANTWQGVFPALDTGQDGYKARTAPVGCFAANSYGLYDMTGNVWEWTSDWYGDKSSGQHLVKGGSYLCADNFCARFRPSAREPGPPDTGSSHIGFRTVRRGA
jgi:formylglycine-generating enzyme required for sulfatase activity